MNRYKLTIEYDGTGLVGWQRQSDAMSIQQCIEESIEKFSGENVRLHVAGRTDAGVHAFGQVAHFDMQKIMPPLKVMGAINQHIRPNKIVVVDCENVNKDFHARFSAKKRYYVYRIINRRAPLAIEEGRAWFVPVELDIDKMKEAASYLIGQHDFTSFRDSQCQSNSPIKTLDEIRIEKNGELIRISVSAQSFLHHMVRNITGTLKLIGEGKWQPEYIKEIIASKNRCAAGPTAPAYGLYFIKVDY
ncbi:MAG: tRNA pseudouridine(38-40) synthase TruA [Alphaproteobacteria bacterium CG11_big_fil_rev_8_21_14_0_20_39_49]|nr:MAG: tRNA pseudouridine(38-40) synthase TruA [Alphaproteobacteria bacterium CG11_big_fil_rev_8_21_14_0_20_39_49]